MFGPDRDSAWAWITLTIAVIASLVAAPWDAGVRSVSIDGSVPANALAGEDGAAVGGNDVLAGGEGTSTESSDGSTSSAAASGSTGSTGSVSGTTSTSTGGTSSTSGSSTGSNSGSTSGSTAPSSGAPAGPGTGTPPGPGTGAPTGTAGAVNGKGVSDTQVRIGFTDLIGQQDAAGQLGIAEAFPDPGDTKAQLQAMVDWANANGGIGGRELVPVIKEIDMLESSDSGEDNICTSFVEDQDQDVFAAVLIGTIREQMRQCLAEGGVVTIDPSAYPMTGYLYDSTVIDGIPYMWSPNYPTLNDVGEVLADHLVAMDYFEQGISPKDPCVIEPCKLGIVMYDFPNYNRLLEEEYMPRFEAYGHPIVSVQKVDSRDAGSIESGLTNAVVGLQRDGVSRVLFMGGAPLGVFFAINAAYSGYTPVYGVSSFDQPRFATDNSNAAPDQAWGMRGVGFAATMDVHDDKYQRDNAYEALCLGILAERGITFESRAEARISLAYCQSIMMLKKVADATGPDLTAKSWTDGAANLGEGFQTADAFHTVFSKTRRAGSNQFRRFAVNPDCYCTEYVSDLYTFLGR